MERSCWEYLAVRLWGYVGGQADLMNDAPGAQADRDAVTMGAVGLLNAKGAEGWELVSVVRQQDPQGDDGWSLVAYLKRPVKVP